MTPLTTAFDDLAPLHRPLMVLALRGLFDVAEVATDGSDRPRTPITIERIDVEE